MIPMYTYIVVIAWMLYYGNEFQRTIKLCSFYVKHKLATLQLFEQITNYIKLIVYFQRLIQNTHTLEKDYHDLQSYVQNMIFINCINLCADFTGFSLVSWRFHWKSYPFHWYPKMQECCATAGWRGPNPHKATIWFPFTS